MRALELFSGIGGWRQALGARGRVVAAYDVSPAANATYQLNHHEAPIPKELATVPATQLLGHQADLWLLSPPCQPFCRMGNHQGLGDARSKGLLRILELFREAPPRHFVLENVLGFLGSEAHLRLSRLADEHGLHQLDLEACPTAFGIPNQRPRAYVVISKSALKPRPVPGSTPQALSAFLEAEPGAEAWLHAEVLDRHHHGMDFVAPEDRRSTCFIGGYGRRLVGSGSFLRTPQGTRRFTPREVARLLGLPEGFRFPSELSWEVRYRLLGNGLSLPVAAWVIDHL